MKIKTERYTVDEKLIETSDGYYIEVRNLTGLQIIFSHPFLPPKKEYQESKLLVFDLDSALPVFLVLIWFIGFISSVIAKMPLIVVVTSVLIFFHFLACRFYEIYYEKQEVYFHGKNALAQEEHNNKVADWNMFPYRLKFWFGNFSDQEIRSTDLEYLLTLQRDILRAKQIIKVKDTNDE